MKPLFLTSLLHPLRPTFDSVHARTMAKNKAGYLLGRALSTNAYLLPQPTTLRLDAVNGCWRALHVDICAWDTESYAQSVQHTVLPFLCTTHMTVYAGQMPVLIPQTTIPALQQHQRLLNGSPYRYFTWNSNYSYCHKTRLSRSMHVMWLMEQIYNQ